MSVYGSPSWAKVSEFSCVCCCLPCNRPQVQNLGDLLLPEHLIDGAGQFVCVSPPRSNQIVANLCPLLWSERDPTIKLGLECVVHHIWIVSHLAFVNGTHSETLPFTIISPTKKMRSEGILRTKLAAIHTKLSLHITTFQTICPKTERTVFHHSIIGEGD